MSEEPSKAEKFPDMCEKLILLSIYVTIMLSIYVAIAIQYISPPHIKCVMLPLQIETGK